MVYYGNHLWFDFGNLFFSFKKSHSSIFKLLTFGAKIEIKNLDTFVLL